MRSCFLILLFFAIISWPASIFPFSQNYIEFDLNTKEIKLVDFNFGDYTVSGDFSFRNYQEAGSAVYAIEGRNLLLSTRTDAAILNFNDKLIPWFALKMVKQGQMLFVEYLFLPQFLLKGNLSLADGQFYFDIKGEWEEDSEFLKGHLAVFAKAWGRNGNFSLSGYLTMNNGVYKGRDFSRIRLDFLGKPPVLNITDSEFILENGTVAAIAGDKVLDLRNFSNLIPGAEFNVRKAFVDEWQVFSEDARKVGLKKNLDENLDISVGADKKEAASGPQTELRYRMKEDKYFKLKMQDEGSVVGLEKRKDF